MDSDFLTLLLVAGVALSAPLLFAALGELVSETAGVINIGLEAMMLAGAFCGVWGAHVSGSVGVGFVAAAGGGLLVAGLHGATCLWFRANQVVSGVVLNVLVLGLTTFGIAVVFGSNLSRSVPTLERVRIPLLADLPVVGPAFFDQTLGVYAAFLLVPVLAWILGRTVVGLMLKAAGERPESAESLGVRVNAVRWSALLCCGAVAGIGGGQLTLAGLGAFTQNVTAGRGFIALAAVVFGRWRPVGTMVAVLLFAIADAFQIRARPLGVHVPYQLLAMLPYLVTVLALALLVRRMRAPAALGMGYERG
jgi:general nucleoside transport system permease protein